MNLCRKKVPYVLSSMLDEDLSGCLNENTAKLLSIPDLKTFNSKVNALELAYSNCAMSILVFADVVFYLLAVAVGYFKMF